MSSREERIGLNEAVFREVNERIEHLAQRFELNEEPLDLVCECGDAECVQRISMTRAEYEQLRSDPRHSQSIPVTGMRMSKRSSSSVRATTSSARTRGSRRRSRSIRIPAPDEARTVVAALGDSITEGSPGYDSRLGGDEQSLWEHWAALADPRLEFRNCGIYGERTDQIRGRLQGCVEGADVLVVQGGINDIAQGVAVETAAENLREMVQRGKELGLRVVLVDILPWNNGWPAAEPEIRRLNVLIQTIAREEGVAVLQFHDTLEDPDRPGRMREDWTSDGDHPSVAGYRRLGELAFRLPS